jgi:hypothetical protein
MNKKILGLAILFGILALNQMGLAQFPQVANPNTTFPGLVSTLFKILIGLIAIVAVIFIIMGAFQFFTAGGDPGKATQAKQQIIYAVIGLSIAAIAWALVTWLINQLGVPTV